MFRGVAFSMIVMTGRLGAIFGIIVVGILIDKSCLMTFYTLALLVSSEYNKYTIKYVIVTIYIYSLALLMFLFFLKNKF